HQQVHIQIFKQLIRFMKIVQKRIPTPRVVRRDQITKWNVLDIRMYIQTLVEKHLLLPHWLKSLFQKKAIWVAVIVFECDRQRDIRRSETDSNHVVNAAHLTSLSPGIQAPDRWQPFGDLAHVLTSVFEHKFAPRR